MTDTVFKVCYKERIDSEWHYFSVAKYFRPKDEHIMDIALEYSIGKVTSPKIQGSVIFAFDSRSHARSFIGHSIGWSRTDTIILECEYEADDKPHFVECSISPQRVIAYWDKVRQMDRSDWRKLYHGFLYKNSNNNNEMASVKCVPTGTVMCKWVKTIGIAS